MVSDKFANKQRNLGESELKKPKAAEEAFVYAAKWTRSECECEV